MSNEARRARRYIARAEAEFAKIPGILARPQDFARSLSRVADERSESITDAVGYIAELDTYARQTREQAATAGLARLVLLAILIGGLWLLKR